MINIEFDEQLHEYKIDGVKVPSVTQVLSDCNLINFDNVKQEVLDYACMRGVAVHKATEYFDKDMLDMNSVDDEVMPYLEAWIKFKEHFKVEMLEIEKVVGSKKYRYAGTFDRVAKINGSLCIVDIKTGGKQDAHAIQTAGYTLAYYEMTGQKIKERMCVYLTNKGTYKLGEHKDQRLEESLFLSALGLYNYKRR